MLSRLGLVMRLPSYISVQNCMESNGQSKQKLQLGQCTFSPTKSGWCWPAWLLVDWIPPPFSWSQTDLARPWLLSMVLGKARWVVREQSQGVQEGNNFLNQVLLHYRGALEVFILPDDCAHETGLTERKNNTWFGPGFQCLFFSSLCVFAFCSVEFCFLLLL